MKLCASASEDELLGKTRKTSSKRRQQLTILIQNPAEPARDHGNPDATNINRPLDA
jgi:hypothetical protein